MKKGWQNHPSKLLFTALIVLLMSCSSALLISSSNQPPNVTNYFWEKHQLFLTTLPFCRFLGGNSCEFLFSDEQLKEKPEI